MRCGRRTHTCHRLRHCQRHRRMCALLHPSRAMRFVGQTDRILSETTDPRWQLGPAASDRGIGTPRLTRLPHVLDVAFSGNMLLDTRSDESCQVRNCVGIPPCVCRAGGRAPNQDGNGAYGSVGSEGGRQLVKILITRELGLRRTRAAVLLSSGA